VCTSSSTSATVSTLTKATPSSKSTLELKRKYSDQDDVKKRMLEMAEKEHKLKMEILHLKKQYIEAKIHKLDEISFNRDGNNSNQSQNNAQIWQPFNS
jgi:regulator of replication initiation timing